MFSVLISHNESASLKLSERSVCDEKKKKKTIHLSKTHFATNGQTSDVFFFYVDRYKYIYIKRTIQK